MFVLELRLDTLLVPNLETWTLAFCVGKRGRVENLACRPTLNLAAKRTKVVHKPHGRTTVGFKLRRNLPIRVLPYLASDENLHNILSKLR